MNETMRVLPEKKTEPGPRPAQVPAEKTDEPIPQPYTSILNLQRAGGNSMVNSLLQAQLSVSQPEDAYEREANQVANQVMLESASPSASTVPPEADGEEESRQEKVQPISQISRKPSGEAGFEAPAEVESAIQQSKGRGNPLPRPLRARMEQSFGADFSRVRIHQDSAAARVSRAINAYAFTHGSDIYFNSRQYNPYSYAGRHLLAHELTHVVQQNSGIRRKSIQRAPIEETRKYTGEIDYKKAKKVNLETWYDNYKFYNLFKEKEIYPGSTPVAYANHVYEIQLKLEDAYASKWQMKEAGILEEVVTADSTLYKLVAVAAAHQKDPTLGEGFDEQMLKRLNTILTSFEDKAPPLVSAYFSGVRQWEAVNRNPNFFVSLGDRGDYVAYLQEALLSLNYNLGSDVKIDPKNQNRLVSGEFGRGTRKAVISFQKDSGLEGKDVDGIVGQTTLRLLDQRIGKSKEGPNTQSGTAYAFHVPVSPADLTEDREKFKTDLLVRTLKHAFPISDEQIDILVRSNWHWRSFRDITQADVDAGYTQVTISITDYQSVVGVLGTPAGAKAAQDLEANLSQQTIDLLKTGKLYELSKKISDLEETISDEYFTLSEIRYGPARQPILADIQKNKAALEALKKERQAELNRLGITLEEYETNKENFIKTFERYAAVVAFRMLAENEIQANIEAQHYTNLAEVTAVKSILSDLSGKYSVSEKLWWQGVSLEDSGGRDPSLYKDDGDYYQQHTAVAGEDVVDTSNPERYYSEENVSKMYQAQEKNPSSYYTPWKEKEKEVVTTLQGAVKKYPILAYPKLELRRNAGVDAALPDTDLQAKLLGILNDDDGIKKNIESTRADIAKEPDKIWELPAVVLRAQYELGVIGGVPGELIKAKQASVKNKSFWKSIGLAILGIGLGLLALVSGPVGWLALGASIAVGSYDAYRTYNDITFKKETANSAIDPASALGDEDPSYFWFYVSLVSVGFDAFQAVKVIKSIAKGVELAEEVTKGFEAARAAALERLAKAGGGATEEGKTILKEIEEIDTNLSKVKSTEFAENWKLLKPLEKNPAAVLAMSEALKDKKIFKAITYLGKLVEKDAFEDALKVLGGVGRKSLDDLPELARLIREGNLSGNKRLITELLADPRAQRLLIDTQDTALFASKFAKWEEALKAGESVSFVRFLEAESLTARLTNDTRLVDLFGEAFATLPNAVKNRQILRTVEPALLDALNAGSLPKETSRALEVLLNSDVLAQTARLSSAQERLLYEIRLLGSVIETQGEFSKVANLLSTPAARRALWEGATQLAGKDKYLEKIARLNKLINGSEKIPPDVLDDLIRIGPLTDEDTIKTLLGPAGERIRKALAASPEAIAVLKKCASPCLPPFVTEDQISLIGRIMKGKSNDELLRIREFLYANRGSEDAFKSALQRLEKDLPEALKDVALPVLAKPKNLDVSEKLLRDIIDLGLPVSELNKIMKRAAGTRFGSEMMTELLRVLQFEKNVPLKNFDVLLKGLAEGNAAEFRAAQHLLDESSRFANAAGAFKYAGLQKADVLLSRFSLEQLNALMNARWTEGFVNSLYEVIERLPKVNNHDITELILKAGGGKAPGDLGRLRDILATLKAPAVTVDEAAAAIQAADSFAADVAKALKDPATGYDALVKLIWGEKVKVEKGVIKVTDSLGGSGSDIYQTVFKLGESNIKGDSIAKSLLRNGAIGKDKWVVFRKVIEDSNIASSIKSNIIGEMWTRVNEQLYRGLGYTVFREVPLTAGKVTAKADLFLFLEKGGSFLIVECKTGEAVLSEEQKVIYALLEKGDFKSLLVRCDEALAARFADPKTNIQFLLKREADFIP